MEALISELYGALSMAKLTADVGPCSSMADVQIYTARGSMPWALKGTRHAERPGGVSRVHASPRRRPLLRGMRS